jgi:crotonobetainyl-CoA:carnitine CoA-transferase CaiB-like acyl-CoA transferase
VDLSRLLPGPWCSQTLGDLGAEVTKIEQPDDRAVALGLLQQADIVVESYRPGLAEKLGIDYATLTRDNPGVIYCSVTGFGSKGELPQLPGHDLSIQHAAARRARRGIAPRFVAPPQRLAFTIVRQETGHDD